MRENSLGNVIFSCKIILQTANLHILMRIAENSHCTIFRHIFYLSVNLKYSWHLCNTMNEKVKATICFRIRNQKIRYNIKFIRMYSEESDIIHCFYPYFIPSRRYEVFWSCNICFQLILNSRKHANIYHLSITLICYRLFVF